MHSFEAKKNTFQYNVDGSGDVTIVRHCRDYMENCEEFEVPIEDVLDFVANLVRNAKIAEREQADAKDVLGLVR